MMIDPVLLCVALMGYLFGSFPSGLVMGRLFGLGDIRNIGSGNIGATNALRTGNKKMAAATFFFDVIKGVVPVVVTKLYFADVSYALYIAGVLAMLGHIFPVWLKFKGGKGVATACGVLLGIYWPMALIAFTMWIVTAFLSRYSSLSALIASANAPFYAIALGRPDYAPLLTVLAVILWASHHQNIRRLLKGQESRIGEKK